MIGFLIHSPVPHFSRLTPDQPALSFNGSEFTYSELDRASNQLAHALLRQGLRPQDRVGIFMHKSLELGVAIHGILKAGGVFVPLDPFLPVGRIAFILRDCGIRHLVSSDTLAMRLNQLEPPPALRVYGVSRDNPFPALPWEDVYAHDPSPPEVPLIDQDLGYIMYTSGSTGEPKGMMHTHHGSVSYARWGALHVGLHPGDRVASHAPLHFDLSIFDFFSTAQAGAAVVLVPEPVTKFPASWTQYIQDERITVVFTVPHTLVDMLERGAMDQRDLSSLRWILFGGEPFPTKHLRALMDALPWIRFTNVYGPAEAPSCTCYDVPALPEGFDAPIPIGTVSENSAGVLLAEDDRECGVGEQGELCIRSSTLTRGYWHRPDLNERVFFRRASFGPFPDVYFRTGDLAMRDEEGLLHFLGRKDRMIKTRGNRVELDDVEAALTSHVAVLEAATYVVPDGRGSTHIEAAVTLRSGSIADVSELLRHARTVVPGYAVPRRIAILNDLPRTSSGKVDLKRLAESTEGSTP